MHRNIIAMLRPCTPAVVPANNSLGSCHRWYQQTTPLAAATVCERDSNYQSVSAALQRETVQRIQSKRCSKDRSVRRCSSTYVQTMHPQQTALRAVCKTLLRQSGALHSTPPMSTVQPTCMYIAQCCHCTFRHCTVLPHSDTGCALLGLASLHTPLCGVLLRRIKLNTFGMNTAQLLLHIHIQQCMRLSYKTAAATGAVPQKGSCRPQIVP